MTENALTQNFQLWFSAFRPKTLSAAVVPIIVGSAVASAIHTSEIETWLSVFALLASVCIQIATNLVNDAKDFQKGADREDRLGPMRVTQAGHFTAAQVLNGALVFFGLAIVFGIPLVMTGGLPILVVGLVSLLAGYSYTGGPFPLAYRGLGDLFVFLFFGLVAVTGMSYLLDGRFSGLSAVAGAQVGFLSTVLIAINNLRDVETDTRAHKKTLAVRFGKTFVRREIMGLLLAPYFLLLVWLWQGFLWAAILPIAMLPLAVILIRKIWTTEPSAAYNKFLGMASLHHMTFGLLLAIGLGMQ